MITAERLVFAVLVLISLAIFLRRAYVLLAMVSLGRWENRFDHLWQRFKGMVTYGFLQKRVVRKAFGVNHLLLCWGFLVLALVNMEFVISGIFPKFSLEFIGHIPFSILTFLADVMSGVVFIAVIVALTRRTFFRPPYIEATKEAYIILFTVGVLMAAYFGMNMAAGARGVKALSYMPISLALSSMVPVGVGQGTLFALQKAFWWAHALVFLFFLDFIPYSKHLHILTSLPNCFFRNLSFVSSLPKMVFQANSTFGVSKFTHFTWKDLLDFLACTECGRCQSVCPASAAGKALNPKEVVHSGKRNLLENGLDLLEFRPLDTLGRTADNAEVDVPLIGEGRASVSAEAVWDCTTCGACMDICPVFIEHTPKLVEMRRHLVMEKVDFPSELTSFFENIEQRSNPWALAPSDRAKWSQQLGIPHFSKAEGHEYLLYAGCLGSYDSRAKKVATSVAEVLRAAGISFGVLGADEKCCGDSLRRLGNEYIFDRTAKENVSLFRRLGVEKVVTICPHCYNTLKNDYREYGADYQVFHHVEIMEEVLNKGFFKPNNQFRDEHIVIHDSCYLARYNDIIDQPRTLIRGVIGTSPIEMENKHRDGFCCGAGGGRMWLEEDAETRVNRERIKQALKQKPTIIATCCPFCVTMFEDGLKERDAAEVVKVMDVGEIIHEGMVLPGVKGKDAGQSNEKRAINA